MKRLKRTEAFEVSLVIKDEHFINPPKTAQRNAVVNRALKEFTADLNALNEHTKNFVPGETSANDNIGLAERGQAQLSRAYRGVDLQWPCRPLHRTGGAKRVCMCSLVLKRMVYA